MKNDCTPLDPAPACILLLFILLTGCASPEGKVATGPRNRAFITYSAPAAESKALRVAVKDLIDMKGTVTTAGSKAVASLASPATQDARCLRRLRQKDIAIVGKTNLTELAITVSGINGYYGTPRNPLAWQQRLIPGGSSSGSAVAVASGLADIAIGTDTAGSIRVPAACCGIMGLKTTFGLVPLDGVFPLSPDHLDTVGPMARNIEHLARGMDLLQSGFMAQYQAASAANASGRSIRVGRLYIEGTDPSINKAIDRALAAAQFEVVVLSPEFQRLWKEAEEDGKAIAVADAWLHNRHYLEQEGLTGVTKVVLAQGEPAWKNSYQAALRSRAAWRALLRQVFTQVDFIALPTLKQMPPTIPLIGGVLFEVRVLALQNTAAVNLAGNPALAFPIPMRSKRVPATSLQLVGPPRSEAALLNAGRLLEQRL